jgi:hypothetical protein
LLIGTVVEGPTDRLLLKTILDELCPDQPRYLDLQPGDVGHTFGERGTGWRGVQRFCADIWQQLSDDLPSFLADYGLDLLIIHLDADVVNEADLELDLVACPPIAPAVEQLQMVVAGWLNLASNMAWPARVIFAVPAQDSESWLFAALFPDDQLCQQDDYECLHPRNSKQHPGYLLTLREYDRVLQRKHGRIQKSRRNYEAVLPDLAANWPAVRDICSPAGRFETDLARLL